MRQTVLVVENLRSQDLAMGRSGMFKGARPARKLLVADVEGGVTMKAVAISLMLLGLVAGCSRHTASTSGSPSASPGSYTTKGDCVRAGYTWDAGTCK
jgi:hypothetical protein